MMMMMMMMMMMPFLYGHQTEFAYSRCGLTIALYSKTQVLNVQVYKISFNDT